MALKYPYYIDEKIILPVADREIYILQKNITSKYTHDSIWSEGIRIRRISKWLSGNGCGVKQAYFEKVDRPGFSTSIWEDEVKPECGQQELFFE